MDNCEKFAQYLETKGISTERDMTEDGDVFLYMTEPMDGIGLLHIFFDFGTQQNTVVIRIYDIAKIDSPVKREELLQILNTLNYKYNFAKYTVNDEGSVCCSNSAIINESYDCEVIVDMLGLMLSSIKNEAIKKLMRLQWA